MRHCTHFVGFRGEEYHSAVKAFGPPDFIHRGWDNRAQREIADGDLVVFAKGTAHQEPRARSFDDIRENIVQPQ
ncbi:hypothetical protein KVG22_19565 [Nitratireductor sp. R6]|uniref:Uncharacterized protein n=1 Tax=Nitratireductor rhodophyticola TaxID=2854036 RepID=A0ABS7RD09_9HYPH|nr:hypothetical protein [Nitratireductor rhodophyticola]MBY8918809.1 hypothetical protein [Nitratireductor rhodophyticola]